MDETLKNRVFNALDELLWTLEDADLIDDSDDCRYDEWGELCRGACDASGCLKGKRDRALALMKEIAPDRKRVGDEEYAEA